MRHVLVEGDPWFVAIDVCQCLGLKIKSGAYSHMSTLAADEKQLMRKGSVPAQNGELFRGMTTQLVFVSESGLYKLIMRSEKAAAREFQDWVTREVLPSIRKTGGYLLKEDMRSTAAADSRAEFPMPSSFSDALRKLADEVERREQSEKLAAELAAAREADKPKVDFVDRFVDASGTMSLSDVARTLGYSSPGAFTSPTEQSS